MLIPGKRFLYPVILIVAVVAGGTAGYMLLEGWSFPESVYMAVITLSTVGFKEVHPLTTTGQYFTILYIAFSIFTVGFTVSKLLSFLFEGQIAGAMKEHKMKKRLSLIKDHYIICGFGAVGREAAEELDHKRAPFVIVEKQITDADRERFPGYLFVQGDATEEVVLEAAKIERAAGLVTCLSDDHQNVFVALTARQMNPGLQIVSRCSDDRTVEKLKKAGADRVISPQQIAGKRMAAVATQPAIVDFLDVISSESPSEMGIQAVRIPAGSILAGKTLRESNVGQYTGAIIIGIIGPDGLARTNPSAMSTLSAVVLEAGDQLIALGNEEQVGNLREFCG